MEKLQFNFSLERGCSGKKNGLERLRQWTSSSLGNVNF